MVLVELTRGLSTMIDDSDIELISNVSWYAHETNPGNFYARGEKYLGNYKVKKFYLHRLLLGVDDPKIKVDHIDGNPLNNQRSNLRVCARESQNHTNQTKLRSDNTSGYRGVFFNKNLKKKKWQAYVHLQNKKRLYLGCFETAEEAAKAFDEAAKIHYGEFHGKLNF